MSNIESFSISPAPGMIDVIGHSGYTFNFAIADLIDNCISANAKSILVFFDLDDDNPYIYVKDDGDGMSLEKLKEAAVIGYKDINEYRDKDDLGRYSTGLKSATRSFCDSIIVSSKVKNSSSNSIKIDYEYIIKNKKREAFIINDFCLEKDISNAGTIIYCEKINFLKAGFDKNNIYIKLDELQKSLSHIFGKFIISKKIEIKIQVKNSKAIIVSGWNPFSLIENKTTKIVYEKVYNYLGQNINFKAYVLPVYNNLSKIDQAYIEGNGLLEQSGFYIYRNNRLIQEGGWLNLDNIGLDDKCKYARIEVNIPSQLDKEFQINFSKNSLVIPDELKGLFIEIAKKARKESRNNFNFQKHPVIKFTTKKHTEQIWITSTTHDGLVLNINVEHPLIKELSKEIPISSLKCLFSTLSKSLPIGMIQAQETTTISYTENELYELMTRVYKELSNENYDIDEIKKKMVSMEPFKYYKEILIGFFDKIGGTNNE